MSYRIGICEDEKVFQDSIAEMVKEISQEKGLQVKVKKFSNASRLKHFMDDLLEDPLDLILLDIYLENGINGMDFAKELRNQGDNTNVIFITNSKDFALDGYTIDSKAYILKPVKKEKLEEAILRTIESDKDNRLILQTPSKILTLDLNRILYIEIINKELIIHYNDGTIDTLRMTLRDVKSLLPEEQFAQSHRSYIVSIPAIKSLENKDIVLTNNERIPISRKYAQTLQDKLMEWYLNS